MNPWDLSASDLLVWGIVLHLVADWPLQNDWMAQNKMYVWDSSAGFVHAGIHGILLAVIFGWMAVFLAIAHFLIDTRRPVIWWSKKIKQTQPKGNLSEVMTPDDRYVLMPVYDVGIEVRFWTDQVFHIVCIAIAALVVTL